MPKNDQITIKIIDYKIFGKISKSDHGLYITHSFKLDFWENEHLENLDFLEKALFLRLLYFMAKRNSDEKTVGLGYLRVSLGVDKGLLSKLEANNIIQLDRRIRVENKLNQVKSSKTRACARTSKKSSAGRTKKGETDKYQDSIKEIILHFNEVRGTNFKPTTKPTQKQLLKILNTGISTHDIKKLIDFKYKEWRGTKFENNVSPDTIFRDSNFDRYLEASKNWIKPVDRNQQVEDKLEAFFKGGLEK